MNVRLFTIAINYIAMIANDHPCDGCKWNFMYLFSRNTLYCFCYYIMWRFLALCYPTFIETNYITTGFTHNFGCYL